MADLTENDDDLIPVETPPTEDTEVDAPVADADADADDSGDDEDERLAESDDDHDEDVTASNRSRRHKRREMQKRAKEKAQRELEMLRQTNAELMRRVAAIEGQTLQSSAQTLEQRLAQAQREVQQAETIIAKATEAGNGEDVVAAMRIRDQAIAEAQQLAAAKQQFDQVRQQPVTNPQVVNYAKEWLSANPWYDPQGRDRDSALTKAIDNELAREGYNPATREYWEELTARVSEAFGGADDGGAAAPSRPKRKAPPTGTTREHVPPSTKKEIYVTPERKEAMIEAGVWDDPVQRQRYLKAYQAYDNGSAR